jgi:subtilisin family serine protease
MRLAIVCGRSRRIGHAARGTGVAGLAITAAAIVAVSAGSPALAVDPTGTIRDAGTMTVVPGSFVVVLRPGGPLVASGDSVGATASRLAARYSGQVGPVFRNALEGFGVRMAEADAKRLAADPAVQYVQRNGVHSVAETQHNPPSWGLDRIDQRRLPLNRQYSYPNVAPSVTAYIVDTGIRLSHQDFDGRARSGRDTVDNDNDATDCHGHGTHMAGTVGGSRHGVAKRVKLVAVRVVDCTGEGTTEQVVAGVDWVTRNARRPAVANLSIGSDPDDTIDRAVRNSIRSGITWVVAAGNENASACTISPARVTEAITVAATDIRDNRASFSNFGRCLDIFAPGVNITSDWYTGNTATMTMSGTSPATAHVSGAAALVIYAHPGFSPQQVRNSLVNDATSGVVRSPGPESPNNLLFIDQSR